MGITKYPAKVKPRVLSWSEGLCFKTFQNILRFVFWQPKPQTTTAEYVLPLLWRFCGRRLLNGFHYDFSVTE
jgi:hypothetical protein